MHRTRNLNLGRKTRARKLPRRDRRIRRYDSGGWEISIYQQPSGTFLVCGFEIDGDDWRVESASTVKAALAAIRQPTSDVEKLLDVEE